MATTTKKKGLSDQVPADPNPDTSTPPSGLDALNPLAQITNLAELTGGAQIQDSPTQTQLREGAQHFHNLSGVQWDKLSAEEKAQKIYSYITDSPTVFSPQTFTKVQGEEKKAAPGAGLPSPGQAAQSVVAPSPYEKLADSLASSYLQQAQQLQSLVSGAETPALAAEAKQGASGDLAALLGGSPLLASMQGFLTSTPQAPLQGQVDQAKQAQGNALAAGDLGMAGAIGQSGLANTEYLSAAPYAQILQELANETAYKAASGTGAAAFGATKQNTPTWLQTVFQNLGLPVAGGVGGALPGLPTPKAASAGGTKGTTPTDNANASAP